MARTETERRLEAVEVQMGDLRVEVRGLQLFEREIRTWVKAAALLGPVVTAILVILVQRWLS